MIYVCMMYMIIYKNSRTYCDNDCYDMIVIVLHRQHTLPLIVDVILSTCFIVNPSIDDDDDDTALDDDDE